MHAKQENQMTQKNRPCEFSLQVFELSIVRKDGIAIQQVVHKQECPPASNIPLGSKVKKPLIIEEIL